MKTAFYRLRQRWRCLFVAKADRLHLLVPVKECLNGRGVRRKTVCGLVGARLSTCHYHEEYETFAGEMFKVTADIRLKANCWACLNG